MEKRIQLKPQAKVLVVDNESILARYVGSLVADNGYELIGPATSGEEALDLCRSRFPDVALLDVGLGAGIDGVELAQKLREMGSLGLIFMTGYEDDALFSRIQKTDPKFILYKPVSEAALLNNLKICLDQRDQLKEWLTQPLVLRDALKHAPTSCWAVLWGFDERRSKVAALAMAGQRNKQIALALGMSTSAVHDDMKTIFETAGVHSRAELVSKASRASSPDNPYVF